MSRVVVCQGPVERGLAKLPDQSVQCVVTSPPYWGLRSYLPEGHPDKGHEIGTEATPDAYVARLVAVFREVWRVLRDDGVLFLNLGDCYHDKQLAGVPWRVALALQEAGWRLRSDVIWAKAQSGQRDYLARVAEAARAAGVTDAQVQALCEALDLPVGTTMPESTKDRPTRAHEYVFILSKRDRYFWDIEAVKESAVGKSVHAAPGQPPQTGTRPADGGAEAVHGAMRNLRSVWAINPKPYKGAHFAVFPPEIPKTAILAATSEGGACAACGAPYRRLVEDRGPDLDAQRAAGGDEAGAYDGTSTKDHDAAGVQDASAVKARVLAGMRKRETVGWQKPCACDTTDVRPCLVLDPFAGSGTTLGVAVSLGREAIGTELNPDYVPFIRERVEAAGGTMVVVDVRA